MAFDLKTATPDTTFPAGGFLFGADSQAADDPAIYSGETFMARFNLFADTNILEQRNGAYGQTLRVYNTYTDALNYERVAFFWAGNVFNISAQRLGTGSERPVQITSTNNTLIVTTSATDGLQLNPNNGSNVNVMTGGAAGSLTRGLRCGSFFEFTNNRTIANLPSSPTVGMIVRVTDANSPAIGSTVASGGAAAALVWYNGTNWTVIGV